MSKKVGLGLIEVPGRFRPRIMVSTGMFIRDHLLETVQDYSYHMWMLFKETKKRPGSYQNFRNYIYWLLKLNLIKFVREEPSRTPHFKPRRYYTYVPANVEKEELWRNTTRALYPENWKKHHYRGEIPPPLIKPSVKKIRKKKPPKKKLPKVLKRKPREEIKVRKERLVLLKTEEAYKKKLAEGWTFVEMIDGNYLMKPSKV